MRRYVIILWIVACMAWCGNVLAGDLMLSQTIDFLDNAFFTTRGSHYTPEELTERLKLARDAGFKRIYFRAVAGRAYYPSEVLEVYAGDARPAVQKLVDTIRSYDVVAEYIKQAHALGLELYYWEPVFDTEIYLRYAPGTPEHRKYGEFPFRDPALRQDQQWKHRFADLKQPSLSQPIAAIQLRLKNDAAIHAENLELYSAQPEEPFQKYTGTFTVTKESQGTDFLVTISGLRITDPCIKLVNPRTAEAFVAISDTANACTVLYGANGEELGIPVSSEVFIADDKDYANNRHGSSGMPVGWGNGVKGANRTYIIRVGLFDAYAGGLPEYAFRENRDRRLAVLRELFQRYPELDGVCYSIRSHSLPNGGAQEWVGDFAYGFSEPVVTEYRRRYGVDITREPFDSEKLLQLRGEFFTDFLREASEVIHGAGGKFAVMAPVHSSLRYYDHGAMYPLWRGYNIDNFFQIDRWAQEGLVDTVVILGTGHNMPSYLPEWDQEIAAFRAKLAGTSTKLALHYLLNSATAEDVRRLLPPVVRNPDLDEVEIYEEHAVYARQLYPVIEEILRQSERAVQK